VLTIIGATLFHGPVRDGKGWDQRAIDALDIVNVGVEKNIYGVRIKIFVPIGYQKANSGVGYGLRKGYLGKYFIGDPENKISIQNNEDEAKNLPVEYEILLGDTDFTSIKSHS